jgi:hypothetical protein
VNQNRFGAIARALISKPSRRHLLRGLAGAGLGLGAVRLPSTADAKKKRKHKKRRPKAKPNEYGCLEVGNPCKNADQCCSGICTGKKGKRTCRAHDTGTCQQGLTGICSDPPTIAFCNNSDTCLCLTSTANSNFCGQTGQVLCTDCQKDADCEALGLPPGSACLPTEGGLCADQCPETGMVCLAPCGSQIEK